MKDKKHCIECNKEIPYYRKHRCLNCYRKLTGYTKNTYKYSRQTKEDKQREFLREQKLKTHLKNLRLLRKMNYYY